MKTESIKPVILIDFGGVYFTNANRVVPRIYAKKWNIPAKRIQKALLANGTSHATCRVAEEIYWKRVAYTLNITQEQAHQFRHSWFNYPTYNDGMKSLIKKLKKKYRVAALSSIISSWVEVLEKKYDVSAHFHECHYSYNHRCDKPSSKFFMSAAKKMKAKPENCIVIDDSRKFLAAVKKTGARTVLFRNAKQLESQLRKMGVNI